MFTAGPARKRLPVLLGIAACLVIGVGAAVVIGAQQPAQGGDNGITAVIPPGTPASEVSAQLRSSRAITLVLHNLDPQQTTPGAQDFSLQSDQDPAYRKPQSAIRLGLDRQVTGFVDDRTAITVRLRNGEVRTMRGEYLRRSKWHIVAPSDAEIDREAT